jgi:hypothetical protein
MVCPRRGVALTAFVAAAGLLAGCGGPVEGGPLRDVPEHGHSLTVAEGETFTDALESLVVTGDEPAVLDDVELVDAEGLEVVGYQLIGPERKIQLDWIPGYPPRPADEEDLDTSLIVPGDTPIQPGETAGWELLLGIKVTQPGPLYRGGIRYTYTVDGVQYTKTVPARLKVCTSPEHLVDGSCPPPKDDA